MKVYDNTENFTLDFFKEELPTAKWLDIRTGYFHVRGWEHLVRAAGADFPPVRLVVGMQEMPYRLPELVDGRRCTARSGSGGMCLGRDADGVGCPAHRATWQAAAGEFRYKATENLRPDAAERAYSALLSFVDDGLLQIRFDVSRSHGKVYLVGRADGSVASLVGSSNLSDGGLLRNAEHNESGEDGDGARQRAFEKVWAESVDIVLTESPKRLPARPRAKDHKPPPRSDPPPPRPPRQEPPKAQAPPRQGHTKKADPPSPPPRQEPPRPAAAQPTAHPTAPPPRRRSPTGWIVAAVVALLAVIGIAAVSFGATQGGGTGSNGKAYYANCDEARSAGASPMVRGASGYRYGLDGDGDGRACE